MIKELKIEMALASQMNLISEVASPLVVLAELIKNSYDEKAKKIFIHIDTKNKTIQVVDDGRGFTESTIISLSKPGESYKKKDSSINPHNKFFAGSMGIGLLSVFSIAKELEIETTGSEGSFLIKGNKLTFTYEKKEDISIRVGTKMTLKNVNKSDLDVLIDDITNDKIKHISIKNYLDEYRLFDLKVFIDNIEQKMDSPGVEELFKLPECNFVLKVNFAYCKKEKKLTYQVERTDNKLINPSPVVINFNEEVNILNVLKTHYRINKAFHKSDLVYLPSGAGEVSDFIGAFYIKEGKNGAKIIKKFGPAVRLYVNGFAMYNYLDPQNDWLRLSYLTQNVKYSALKPQNTIGYVAFNTFNEYEEELQISKERSHFYNKSSFRAFYEMIYNVITLLTFNIDVAFRNPKYFDKDYLELINSLNAENAASKEDNKVGGDGSSAPTNQESKDSEQQKKDKKNEEDKKQEEEADIPLPTIKLRDGYIEPIRLNRGTNFNPDDFVSAVDSDDEILKSTVTYPEGLRVDVNKVGQFKVNYSVTGKKGRTSSIDVIFIVVDPNMNNSYKPIKGKSVVISPQPFYFTEEEIQSFFYPTGDLSRKIQQVIAELHKLRFEENPVATTALFRVLIELCCRKAADAFDMEVPENSLGLFVRNILNRLSSKLSAEKKSNLKFKGDMLLDDKKAKEIRNFFKLLDEKELKNVSKEVGDKSIIDMLNLYIHRENNVTEDVVIYWERMKPFLVACLRVPK